MARLRLIKSEKERVARRRPGRADVFLEHLDELRSRLIRSIIFVVLAASIAWFVSGYIYNFCPGRSIAPWLKRSNNGR